MILHGSKPFLLRTVHSLCAVLLLAWLGTTGCGADKVIELRADGGQAGDGAGPDGAAGGGESDTGRDDAHSAGDDTGNDGAMADAGHDPGFDAEDDTDPADTGVADAADTGAEDGTGPGPDGAADAADGTAAGHDDGSAGTDDGVDAGGSDAGASGPLPVAVEATLVADGWWAETERCWLEHRALTPERFIARTRHTDAAIVAGFAGDPEPPPQRFLLHAAPGWEAGGAAVLLVHGAGSHATQSFVDPDPAGLDPGLAPDLADAGFAVFAVTFPARFGDNWNQGLALAAALQRVREKTGAGRVHVVAHSKGGLALLAYVSDMLASRGVPYQGEVGRVVLVGVPLGGMDFSFRHPAFNYSAAVWGLELPSSWDRMLLWGVWEDTWDDSIYGGAYDGLLQALARWDDVHPLSMLEQDWWTTYEGGQGYVSHSLGIDAAIEQGGHFLATLRARSLPDELSVALLVGTSAFVGVTPWETTGPSDSLVFVASAADSAWVEGAGAQVVGTKQLAVNHWELVHDDEARDWVRSLLADE